MGAKKIKSALSMFVAFAVSFNSILPATFADKDTLTDKRRQVIEIADKILAKDDLATRFRGTTYSNEGSYEKFAETPWYDTWESAQKWKFKAESLSENACDNAISEMMYNDAVYGFPISHVLKKDGFVFDIAYTSYQKRAIKTLNIVLEEIDELYIPVVKSWRLNERHYGALQGLNKAETAKKYGDEQVHIWRRSFDVPPPALEDDDERNVKFDAKYKDLDPKDMPKGESLKDTINRVMPFWESDISKSIKDGKNVIIAAHGNSLRALIKYLLEIDNEKILDLNLPTGVPLIFEIDENLKITKAPELF